MLNSVSIIGRLTADPEIKKTESEKSVINFSIASERRFVKIGDERKADFFEVVAWASTAEFIVKHFSKGSMIAINGTLQTKSYLDKNDIKRKSTFILTDNVSFCGSNFKTKTATAENEDDFDYNDFDEI